MPLNEDGLMLRGEDEEVEVEFELEEQRTVFGRLKGTDPDQNMQLKLYINVYDPSEVRYHGVAVMQEQMQAPGMPPVLRTKPFEFPIEAGSVEEAFEKFEESVHEAVAEIQGQRQSQIVVPGANVPRDIFRG